MIKTTFGEIGVGQYFFVRYSSDKVTKFKKISKLKGTIVSEGKGYPIGYALIFLERDEVEVNKPEISVEEIKYGANWGHYLAMGRANDGGLVVRVRECPESARECAKREIEAANKQLNPPSKHDELEQLIKDGNVMDSLMLMAQILKEKHD